MRTLSMLLLAGLVVGLTGCGSGETVEPPFCSAGAQDSCTCPDGITKGTHICNQEETAWGDCLNCPVACTPACVPPQVCQNGTCVGGCQPQCTGKTCGPDGCGGQCGTCTAPQTCGADGKCSCTPSCAGKTCGDDGCGAQCGTCKPTETCNAKSQCECVPQCTGKECGDNGCGAACGQCQPGYTCNPQGKCEPPVGDCYLNACLVKDHCKGCPNGLNQCWEQEHQCVECLPGHDEQCTAPLKCSLSGKCTQKTCPTDGSGEPTIQCASDSDCEACSPKNKVCDVTLKKCVQCVGFADEHCLDSQYCKNGKCESKCPLSCETDNDCMYCTFGAAGGGEASPAKACNNHKCSECSESWPCEEGLVCLNNGVCYPPCGIPGPVQGTCLTDQDCYYCGDPKALGSYVCKKPINDPEGHGSCIPSATGCADLGAGVAVLPEPWSDYTQLCSNDSNCNNVSIDFNVGKLIRDLAGVDEILGIEIGDATVKYGMNQCAEIKVTNNINCGVCVPCQKDIDCDPIQVDPVIVEMFKGNPLAQVAGLMLINMLWGSNQDHNLYFYCQPVGLGYGVCAPCANPLQFCGKQEPEPGTGTCNHDVCTKGDALDPSCSACAKEVCANDAYCCTTAWDEICVSEVDKFCATPCGGTTSCADDICANPNLPAQDPSCGPCVAAICQLDPYCCNKQGGAWDKYCVDEAKAEPTCDSQCGGGCAHSECATGGPLAADCSDCAASVCSYDDWCCTNDWDSICVDEAKEDENCPCV